MRKIKTYVLVQHRVRDYNAWKALFDFNELRWETAGLRTLHLFRSADDGNEVTIIFEVDDLLIMQVHLESAGVFQRMKKAGYIVGDIKFDILEKMELA